MPFKKNDPNINRAGRPKKGESMSDILRRRMETYLEEFGMTKGEYIMQQLELKAGEGDLKAIDMLLDRIEGKPTQHIQSENENTLVVEHEITD